MEEVVSSNLTRSTKTFQTLTGLKESWHLSPGCASYTAVEHFLPLRMCRPMNMAGRDRSGDRRLLHRQRTCHRHVSRRPFLLLWELGAASPSWRGLGSEHSLRIRLRPA